MTELSRDDLKWLEDRFKDYPNYDRQIAMRKIELDMKQHDENIGGGKSNITVKTIEVKVIKYLSDPYIASREKWKRAVIETLMDLNQEARSIVEQKYFSLDSYMSWKDLGEQHGLAKSTSYRLRYNVLELFGKKIGYI